MVRLTIRLKGAMLLECIVAGIILLVCFVIVLDTLTRLTLQRNDVSEYIEIEMACREKYRIFREGKLLPGRYSDKYEWGMMETEWCNYAGTLQKLTIVVRPTKGGKVVRYEYLINNVLDEVVKD